MSSNIFVPPTEQSRESLVKHCVAHSMVSAAPSFALAVLFGWNSGAQIAGMLVGIAAFIASAVLLHLSKPVALLMKGECSARAFQWSKAVRAIHAVLIWPCMPVPALSPVLLPDFWAGMLANQITEALGFPVLSSINSSTPHSFTSQDLFSQAVAATFIEGWILAFAVAALTIVFWLLLKARRFTA